MTRIGMGGVRRGAFALVALLLAVAVPPPAAAQSLGQIQSDILSIDPDRLFSQTKLGQSMAAELQSEREALIERNRELEAQLEAEEKALTELRADSTPEEFRDLADAFDAKVQDIRRESERRARDLERKNSQVRITFMRLVEPVLIEIMRDANATVIMDGRTILLRAGSIDITDQAIRRIDKKLGDTQPELSVPSGGNAPAVTEQEGGTAPVIDPLPQD